LFHQHIELKSGIALCTASDGSRFLLGLHEAPHLPENQHSLLSTGQAREHGIWVGDVLKRHGGDQCIRGLDDQGNKISVDINASQGLMVIHLTHPEPHDINNLPILWLTGEEPWNPAVLDDDTVRVEPQLDLLETRGGTNLNTVTSSTMDLNDLDRFMKTHGRQSDSFKILFALIGPIFLGTCIVWSFSQRLKKLLRTSSPDYESL